MFCKVSIINNIVREKFTFESFYFCKSYYSHSIVFSLYCKLVDLSVMWLWCQEELNRGKPNWEHLSEELHVLITVEDTENRARVKLQRAVDEVKKLLVPVSTLLSSRMFQVIENTPVLTWKTNVVELLEFFFEIHRPKFALKYFCYNRTMVSTYPWSKN